MSQTLQAIWKQSQQHAGGPKRRTFDFFAALDETSWRSFFKAVVAKETWLFDVLQPSRDDSLRSACANWLGKLAEKSCEPARHALARLIRESVRADAASCCDALYLARYLPGFLHRELKVVARESALPADVRRDAAIALADQVSRQPASAGGATNIAFWKSIACDCDGALFSPAVTALTFISPGDVLSLCASYPAPPPNVENVEWALRRAVRSILQPAAHQGLVARLFRPETSHWCKKLLWKIVEEADPSLASDAKELAKALQDLGMTYEAINDSSCPRLLRNGMHRLIDRYRFDGEATQRLVKLSEYQRISWSFSELPFLPKFMREIAGFEIPGLRVRDLGHATGILDALNPERPKDTKLLLEFLFYYDVDKLSRDFTILPVGTQHVVGVVLETNHPLATQCTGSSSAISNYTKSLTDGKWPATSVTDLGKTFLHDLLVRSSRVFHFDGYVFGGLSVSAATGKATGEEPTSLAGKLEAITYPGDSALFNAVVRRLESGAGFVLDPSVWSRLKSTYEQGTTTARQPQFLLVPHGVIVPVGVGFSTLLIPDLLKRGENGKPLWTTLRESAARILSQHKEDLAKLGIRLRFDTDNAPDRYEEEQIDALVESFAI